MSVGEWASPRSKILTLEVQASKGYRVFQQTLNIFDKSRNIFSTLLALAGNQNAAFSRAKRIIDYRCNVAFAAKHIIENLAPELFWNLHPSPHCIDIINHWICLL